MNGALGLILSALIAAAAIGAMIVLARFAHPYFRVARDLSLAREARTRAGLIAAFYAGAIAAAAAAGVLGAALLLYRPGA